MGRNRNLAVVVALTVSSSAGATTGTSDWISVLGVDSREGKAFFRDDVTGSSDEPVTHLYYLPLRGRARGRAVSVCHIYRGTPLGIAPKECRSRIGPPRSGGGDSDRIVDERIEMMRAQLEAMARLDASNFVLKTRVLRRVQVRDRDIHGTPQAWTAIEVGVDVRHVGSRKMSQATLRLLGRGTAKIRSAHQVLGTRSAIVIVSYLGKALEGGYTKDKALLVSW